MRRSTEQSQGKKVYDLVAKSGSQGMSIAEIAEKMGISVEQARCYISNYRHTHPDAYLTRRAGRSKVYLALAVNPDQKQEKDAYDEILERLKGGQVIDQYWKGEKTDIDDYGDRYLLQAARRMWMRGIPVIRRWNPQTRLWEYLYINEKIIRINLSTDI